VRTTHAKALLDEVVTNLARYALDTLLKAVRWPQLAALIPGAVQMQNCTAVIVPTYFKVSSLVKLIPCYVAKEIIREYVKFSLSCPGYP
jgi:hypothetical protein